MKKLLLSTTAIAAFGLVAEAEASNLQVNVGGYVDFQAGHVSDDVIGEGTNEFNETEFNTDAEIHFIVEGKADNGLEYGAVVELEADVDSGTDVYDSGNNADKAYLYLQGGWGRVEMGENTGAEQALSVNTANFASATGGVDGDWYRYAGAQAAVNNAFLLKPRLALAEAGHAGGIATEGANEDATKITYYTPRFSGFQAGVSYIPSTGDTARFAAGGGPAALDNEDVVTAGLNFTEQFDEVGVAAAVTGIVAGDDKSIGGTADLEGYNAGLNLTLAGFTLGGSYGDWQDTVVGAATADVSYYDLGLGYAAGPWSASVTYFSSETEDSAGADDEFENLVIGADYQLAPGLVPYAEVAFFEYDDNTAGTLDNEGTVVMLGTQLSF